MAPPWGHTRQGRVLPTPGELMGTSVTPSQDPEQGSELINQPTWGSGWMTNAQHHHHLHFQQVEPTGPKLMESALTDGRANPTIYLS